MKHLAIHALIEMGLLVFNNVGARDTIDLIVGLPKSNELRIAGVRIRTSSYNEEEGRWAFSDKNSKYLIEKPNFFYIFCLKQRDSFKPIFIVISSKNLRKLTTSLKADGNFGIEISKNQIEKENKWTPYLDNFEQIKSALEE